MATGPITFDLRGVGSELKERLLAVPIYQRSFAWTDEQISEFWADISSSFWGGAGEYFLGTIVLTAHGLPPRDTIIDGQQRLATAAILLAAIRDEYKSRGDDKRADIIQKEYLSTSDLATAAEISRLHLNSEDSHFFETRIIHNKPIAPDRSSHILIANAYTYFRAQMINLAKDAGKTWEKRLSDLVEFLKTQVKAIVLEVQSDVDAFLIFETLNDRGADLTIADLLKNYLFGRAGSKLDTVRDTWMQTLGALEITSENLLFTTFLRHYWSSLHGATRERELYKSIKDNVTTESQVTKFVSELQGAATYYSALLHSDHDYWDGLGGTVKENMDTLIRLDLEQNRPLLLAALQHFTPKEIKKLLRLIVSWSVRGLIVGGIGGGTAEKAFCTAAVKIRKGQVKTATAVLSDVASIVPPDKQFEDAFTIARVPKAGLARYYLIALEKGKLGEKEPELVPNSNEEQVNLEHVLPKRATVKEWGKNFDADERKAYPYRLGNLTLLQKGPNGKIGNKPFIEKKPILSKSKFALTKEVGQSPDWTKEAISERQKRLAKLAIKVWPRSS